MPRNVSGDRVGSPVIFFLGVNLLRRLRAPAAMLAAFAVSLFSAGSAVAQTPDESQQDPPPGSIGGLSATQHNVDLVGKVALTGRFGDIRPEQIADVTTKGDYAYLNSWQTPQARPSAPQGSCERGGVFVVDISDPAAPKEVGFIESPEGSYPGEGAQVISLDTPAFKGDVLSINQEFCSAPGAGNSGTDATRRGGISLYDVTNPRTPVPLAQNFGDVDPAENNDFDPSIGKLSPEHDYHSVFSWQDGNRAFAVATDNFEVLAPGFGDIDIFEITNPRAPQKVNDFNLRDEVAGSSAYADQPFLHDMIVKEINGTQTMLISYWDGGYIKLDVDDPANPVFISDTDFAPTDPLFPAFSPPTGNAHQGEFSHDNQFIVAADEEFAPYRGRLTIDGPEPGPYNAAEFPGGPQIQELPDREIGPLTRYTGRSCSADPDAGIPVDDPMPAPPAGAGDKVAVIQRGDCDFAVKAQNVADAGYDAFIVFNNPGRPDGDPLVTNGGGDNELPGLFMTRADGMKIFDLEASDPSPAVGTDGRDVSARSSFDGWGYAHLYDADTMQEIDQYAVREAREERFALDFGDLSIHETANDPVTNLAYISYYDAGFRVVRFGADGMQEVGRFIDTRGNNFWGVETTSDKAGNRLILASDRNYGLYILRYTGPGAVNGPAPSAPPAGGAAGGGPGLSTAPCSNVQAGTAAGERLNGTAEGDRIGAAAGNDVVEGFEGIDCLGGDAGADQVSGDEGGDRLAGGAGRDRVFGDSGRDLVQGNGGKDSARGGSGNDDVRGGSSDDRADGGSNNDTVSGGSGRDRVRGGAGNDRVFGGSGNDLIDGGTGTNRISGGGGRDRILATNGRRDRIKCGKGRDRVRADKRDRVARDCEQVLRVRTTRNR
jgi:hypothetical protein